MTETHIGNTVLTEMSDHISQFSALNWDCLFSKVLSVFQVLFLTDNIILCVVFFHSYKEFYNPTTSDLVQICRDSHLLVMAK